jgi:ergothioneine biosynthesis protein EgtB
MLHTDSGAGLQLLSAEFKQVRRASLAIAAPLSEADMQIQSMIEASPIKWHLAHTTWAFETFILKPYMNQYVEFNQQFEYLFNSYYNAIGEQFPQDQRGLLSRPGYDNILQYRNHVDTQMAELIENTLTATSRGSKTNKLFDLVKLVINHEQQHQELMLTDIKHAFYINPDYPVYQKQKQLTYLKNDLDWKKYPAGLYPIGHQNEIFYFDNEGPQHQVYLQPFQISSRLISCGEYLAFVENGGYQQASFWLSEAWSKINQHNTKAPLYWVKKRDGWYHYTLSGLQSLDLDSPVMHINYFEACAFANSQNKRLPTEQEWEVASRDVPLKDTFFDQQKMHSDSTYGQKLEQMFGELWQWTSSSYNAYPGFKTPEGVIGEYNGKFMVNQYVLRGGSIATPKGHIRPSYRNFFYPDASWQFTGIRLAESL